MTLIVAVAFELIFNQISYSLTTEVCPATGIVAVACGRQLLTKTSGQGDLVIPITIGTLNTPIFVATDNATISG